MPVYSVITVQLHYIRIMSVTYLYTTASYPGLYCMTFGPPDQHVMYVLYDRRKHVDQDRARQVSHLIGG